MKWLATLLVFLAIGCAAMQLQVDEEQIVRVVIEETARTFFTEHPDVALDVYKVTAIVLMKLDSDVSLLEIQEYVDAEIDTRDPYLRSLLRGFASAVTLKVQTRNEVKFVVTQVNKAAYFAIPK